MKRKIILIAMVPVLAGLFALQSCTKESATGITSHMIAMPGTPSPANDAVIQYGGSTQTVNLTWAGSGNDGATWNVYFGTTASPSLVATNVTKNAYTATVTTGGTYYWKVKAIDSYTTSSSSVWQFEVNSNPYPASVPLPKVDSTGVSCEPTLSWTGSDPENDPLTYDLILDTASVPKAVVKAGLIDATYTFTSVLSATTVYYWQIISHDPYGGVSTSPVWTFTTGSLPIAAFTGSYTCAEPAEGWTYPVTFTMATPTTLLDADWWASWPATFTLNLTNLTYNMAYTTFTSGYSGIESGVIDPSTGTMTGTYTVFQNGSAIEQGTHTYTKNKK
ncbi:MAG: hypothetical protein ABSG89_11105 [Bacteroidales bacterium]